MNLSPAPIRNPIVNNDLLPAFDESKSVIAAWLTPRVWVQWFQQLVQSINLMPQLTSMGQSSVSLSAQFASIPAVAMGATNSAGLYRITRYAQVTQAATVNSSLIITIGWTYNGQALTNATTAMVGNTLTTHTLETETSIAFLVDEGTNITYATTYASVGATPMKYALGIRVEQMP